MTENTNQRRDDQLAREPLYWDDIDSLPALRALVANDSYAMSFQTLDQYRSAVLRAVDSVAAAPAPGRRAILTWRQRIGVTIDWPLHAPNDVERAMVAEIAELRLAAAKEKLAVPPRTELSKRIRAAATADVTLEQARLLIGAAEDIERLDRAAQLDGGQENAEKENRNG